MMLFGACGMGVSLVESIRVTAFSVLSKPIWGFEMSLRTIRSAPLRCQLLAGAIEVLARFGGEGDNRLVLAPRGGEGGEDVLGGLQVKVQGGVAGQLAAQLAPSTKVGWSSRHQQDVGVGKLSPAGSGQLLATLDVDAMDAGRLGQGDVGGDQGDLGAPAGGGGRQGDAHAAAGAVAEKADRVDRLARAARGDEHAQAVPRALAAGYLRFDAGEQLRRVGQPALAVLAA